MAEPLDEDEIGVQIEACGPRGEDGYNPFENRIVAKPTTDFDSVMHLLKGSLGSGILAMPWAMSNAGIWCGLFLTPLIGFILTYAVYTLVKNAHRLEYRLHIPRLTFDEIAETAFAAGPEKIQKFAKCAKYGVNLFICLDLFGTCAVYAVFVAQNLKSVIDDMQGVDLSVRTYILLLLPFFLLYVMVRRLKYLVPFSFLGNLLLLFGMFIILYFVFRGLETPARLPAFAPLDRFPIYFGMVIFALEGVCVVMPLENNMKVPCHFISMPGVLCISMAIVIGMYTVLGFFGYCRYGDQIHASITLNVGEKTLTGHFVKIIFAIAMFQTYGVQFYVPFYICWRPLANMYPQHHILAEYGLRWFITIFCIMLAYALPELGIIMSLIGAVTLSFLGLIYPAFIDLATCWDTPGLGKWYWRLWVDLFLIVFGLVGCVTGSVMSILDIVKFFKSS